MDIKEQRLKFLQEWVKTHKHSVDTTFATMVRKNDYIVQEEVTQHRYLLLHATNYQGTRDEFSFEGADTLDEAKAAIEGQVFLEPRNDYTYHTTVVDLDDKKEIEFEIIQEIRWKSAPTT